MLLGSEVRIYSGNYEIISSGIINIKYHNFKVQIKNLSFDFYFEKDETGKAHYQGEPVSETEMRFRVYNMKNALLEGFYTPVEIGTLGDKRLFINFAAWTLDVQENIRTIAYNILLSRGN